jgi:lipopolysaccharide transport system ATP-binding protein
MVAAIRVEGLGKCYRVRQGQERTSYRTLRESLSNLVRSPFRGKGQADERDEFWALKDVSFEVQSGEVVGIIGRNGAGKSTLLKILSRITKPTKGRVHLNGRVGSLLEVGTGFHPELTGRENIYLNGSILGMSREEIKRQFDPIVSFAGVESFLDMPVKRYSSGMYVRLAFAVAAHLEPEILLVDEVLAVGDQAFQKKCIGKMGDIAESGRTVILVSHDLPMLSKLSTVAVWFEGGRIVQWGDPADIVKEYCASSSELDNYESSVLLCNHRNRQHGSRIILQKLSLRDNDEQLTNRVLIGGSLNFDIELSRIPARSDATVVVEICDTFGTHLAQAHSHIQSIIDLTGKSEANLRFAIEDIRLLPGDYSLNVAVGDATDYIDRIDNAVTFSVDPADVYSTGRLPMRKNGLFAVRGHWQLRAYPDNPIRL